MLDYGGKTGQPEFPADRNFPPMKKKGFFKISQNLKLQIIKVLNCKVCIKKLASQMKIFTLSCKIEKSGVIPVVG